ncbi:MAG: hypothetical protein R8M11_02045, partial [Gallionella sp.]
GQPLFLFGRIPDTPNIDILGGGVIDPGTDPDFNTINTALNDLSIAMAACAVDDTSANITALTNAAASLNSAIGGLSIPPYTAAFNAEANNLISLATSSDACDDIKDADQPFLSFINASFSTTQSILNSLITSPDPEMSAAWPAGCFVAGGYWNSWKSNIFYQVDDQYSPNILSNTLPTPNIAINGAGNYRAAVIASRSIVPGGAARDISDATTYLETTNQHQAAPMAPDPNFDTNSPSNLPAYLINNDLVLCVDGNINCP